MAVKSETIIKKMMNELQQAQMHEKDQQTLAKHIGNVHLLCELILAENTSPHPCNELSNQEVKAMMGSEQARDQQNKEKINHLKKSKVNHNQANDDSIFDF